LVLYACVSVAMCCLWVGGLVCVIGEG